MKALCIGCFKECEMEKIGEICENCKKNEYIIKTTEEDLETANERIKILKGKGYRVRIEPTIIYKITAEKIRKFLYTEAMEGKQQIYYCTKREIEDMVSQSYKQDDTYEEMREP